MLKDKRIFLELIKSSAQIELQAHYNKKLVTLVEPQTADSRVEICNIPEDSMVIKVDDFDAPKKIFNGDNGECKRADFVIISFEMKIIVFIELKKNSKIWKNVVIQLMGADCFINYCQHVGKSFWGNDEFLNGYERRYVCISKTNLAKQKTRLTKDHAIHNTPQNALKIIWPNKLQFNQLAGK